jgi:hypothetical protein
MILPWLHTSYLNLAHVASKLYGSNSRLHTHRLKKKMTGLIPFEQWEMERLEQIKQELYYELEEGSPEGSSDGNPFTNQEAHPNAPA